jgi:hypothetical protein
MVRMRDDPRTRAYMAVDHYSPRAEGNRTKTVTGRYCPNAGPMVKIMSGIFDRRIDKVGRRIVC